MCKYEAEQRESYTFAENTLTGCFLKIAKVNLLTGEYEFVKKEPIMDEKDYEQITSIYSYIKKQVDDHLVFSEYAGNYLKYSNPEYVQARIFSGGRRITQSYKRKTENGYMWVTFSIMAPEGCSAEDPWAIFAWRESDTDTTTMVDALSTLSTIYYKILKINLTKDTFEGVKVEEGEQQFMSRLNKISDWWREFAESGLVYEDDRISYQKFTEIERLRLQFRENRSIQSLRYRRKNGKTYRWVQMDLVPSIEYTDDNQILILYVKDIHEEYLSEQQRRQKMADGYNRDALTFLYNRHKYNEDLEELSRQKACKELTCLYVDVNGLHEMNNHLGHQKGDDMLCSVADALRRFFPDERVYRIGGDEFVMLSRNLSKESVEMMLTVVRRQLARDHYEISAGIGSGTEQATVYKIIGAAELAMRADKEQYYKQNDGVRKRRVMNEELEKILSEKQDAEYFLQVIASKFAGVYFVNLRKDTLRHIYIPEYFLEFLEKANFSYRQGMELYIQKLVKKIYCDRFEEVMNFEKLEEKLEEDEEVQITYQKVNGAWMKLRILDLSDQFKEKGETLWIFTDETKAENH